MKNNIICVIACHSNSDLKKLVIKNNIGFLKKTCDKIFIVASSEFPLNLSDICNSEDDIYITTNVEIMHVPNDILHLCYQKYCSWYTTQLTHINQYTDFILTNDSFVLTRDLNDYKQLFHPDLEITGLVASKEIKYHYPDFLIRYNRVGIEKIINHYTKNFWKTNKVNEVVYNFEVMNLQLFTSKQVLYEAPEHMYNIHFHEPCTEKYLFQLNYPIIKLKTFSKPGILPSDFKPDEYRSLHNDLSHMSDNECIKHFLNYGSWEFRKYKKKEKFSIRCNVVKKFVESTISLKWLADML
jgi:hypothetical protein